MFTGYDQTLFDLLAERRLVSPEALAAAQAEARSAGQALSDLLMARGLIEKPVLLGAVAAYLGAEVAAGLPLSPAGDALALIDADLARGYGVVPLRAGAGSITLLAADPFDRQAQDDLSFALERRVRFAVADPVEINALIERCYGAGSHPAEPAPAAGVAADEGPDDGSAEDLAQQAGQVPIVRFVNLLLTQAIRDGASDLHFEPFEHGFRIRSRVDGLLREVPPPPPQFARPVVSRLKVLANLNIAEHRIPQDGRMRLQLAGRAVDLRVSTLPTQFGESVVLRLLDRSATVQDLGRLGLPPEMEADLRGLLRRPHGIFIVTGPTGSGKTTTLYSCLQILNEPDVKILTVEDPVEYEVDGLMQVPVNPAAGLTFERALRTFLRQDPDIVMVGEIRDAETARIAVQAALTGHLVLTTLHTNDAPGAVTRLIDMGIEPFLLASSVEAVLAQRLVRRICSGCRTRLHPPADLLQQADLDPEAPAEIQFFHGAGCAACQQTGYRGRLGLFELLRTDDSLRELIASGAPLEELRRQAISAGLVPLRTMGLRAVAAGLTTLEEILRAT